MPKQQLHARISSASRAKLDQLTEHYGTMTTVLEIAIDRMHREDMPMIEVTNAYGKKLDYEAAVEYMDDDLREELHADLAPCSPQEFFDAYCEAHEEKFGEIWEPAKANPTI